MLKKFILMLIISCVAYAQFPEDALRYSTLNLGAGARAFAMGAAYIGVSDDYTAVFWNPAGLAQLRGFEFFAGLNYFSFDNIATVFNSSNSLQNTSTSLNSIGLTWSAPTIRGSLVFAAGYVKMADYTSALSFSAFNSESSIVPSLYDPDSDYDLAWQLYLEDSTGATAILNNVYQSAILFESGGMNNWLIAGAIDIAKNLSFGVTLGFITGSYKYNREFTEKDSKKFYEEYPWDFDQLVVKDLIDANLSGYSVLLGLMYRSPFIRIGLTARTPSNITVKESYSRSGTSLFDDGGEFSYSFSGASNYTVKTPFYLGGGVSVNLFNVLLVSADVEHIDWSQMEFRKNIQLQELNTEIKQLFTSTLNYRFGAEITLPFFTRFKLRFGYSYKPSPYKQDRNISSRATKFLTFGVGFKIDKFLDIDAAIVQGKWSTTHSQYSYILKNKLYQLITEESISITNLIVSFAYRF